VSERCRLALRLRMKRQHRIRQQYLKGCKPTDKGK
jgi:hypothetical protein